MANIGDEAMAGRATALGLPSIHVGKQGENAEANII